MGTRIDIRRWERPDRPQPVYKGALSLWEAPLAVPIYDASANVSSRMVDRKAWVDVRQTSPLDGWQATVVNGVVSPWIPAFDAELGSARSGSRPSLDVRGAEWSPQPAWIFINLPGTVTTDQLWPAILQNLGLSYRMADRLALDVRSTPEPVFSWAQPVVDAVVSTWLAAFVEESGSARSPDRQTDRTFVQQTVPDVGWVFSAQPQAATVAQQLPAWILGSGLNARTGDRVRLDVRGAEWAPDASGWITVNVPPTPPSGTAPRLILVDGHLAIHLSGILYERLD